MSSREFVSLAFSGDGRSLAAQGGAPDWALSLWLWEKSKLVSSVRTAAAPGHTAVQCSFQPGTGTCGSDLGLSIIANELLPKTKGSRMGWLGVAFGFGLSFGVVIYMFGYISAHLNPASCLASAVACGPSVSKSRYIVAPAHALHTWPQMR
ncbi:hypothetical protein ABPG77_009214 [Micractinium sp. CCAP 211/92]